MKFEEKIRQLRKESGYTQEQLAKRIGISKAMISHYENGDRAPSYDVLKSLARIFHVSTDYLLGVDKEKQYLDISSLNEDDKKVVESLITALEKRAR